MSEILPVATRIRTLHTHTHTNSGVLKTELLVCLFL